MAGDVTCAQVAGPSQSDTLGILAGAGTAPLEIAASVTEAGGGVHILALDGVAAPEVTRFPHTWVGLGQVAAMLAALRAHRCDRMIIIGSLNRPNLFKVRMDLGFVRHFSEIAPIMRGGDDAVLRRVITFFEAQGRTVVGVGDVAPDMLAPAGVIAGQAAHAQQLQAIKLGQLAMGDLSAFDAGQACLTTPDGIVAFEDGAGTAQMLQRAIGEQQAKGAILLKVPKRGQEMRVDMPAVGPQTLAQAHAAGLGGIAVASHQTLIVERAAFKQQADAIDLSVWGIAAGADAPEGSAVAPAAGSRPQAGDNDGRRSKAFTWSQQSDKARAEALATTAIAHVSATVSDIGVIVRRGHPYAILTDGLVNNRWVSRLAGMSPLRWIGVWPRRCGHAVFWLREPSGEKLSGAAIESLCAALRKAGVRSASCIIAAEPSPDPDQLTARSGDAGDLGEVADPSTSSSVDFVIANLSSAMARAGLRFTVTHQQKPTPVAKPKQHQPERSP